MSNDLVESEKPTVTSDQETPIACSSTDVPCSSTDVPCSSTDVPPLVKWNLEPLPVRWVKSDLEKALKSLGIEYHRVTKVFNQIFGKITWANQAQLDKALEVLSHSPLPGCKTQPRLKAHASQAGKLKTQRKRDREESYSSFLRNMRQRTGTDPAACQELQWLESLSADHKKLVSSLMPLSPLTYDEQIAFKAHELSAHLVNAVAALKKATAYSRLPWVLALPKGETICPFLGVSSCQDLANKNDSASSSLSLEDNKPLNDDDNDNNKPLNDDDNDNNTPLNDNHNPPVGSSSSDIPPQNGDLKHDSHLALIDQSDQHNLRYHYRSKTEFTVGWDSSGAPRVGFPIMDMISGSCVIAAPDPVRITSLQALRVASSFQRYLAASPLAPFDKPNKRGLWRGLAVRASLRTGEIMVVVQAADDCTPAEQVAEARASLAAHFAAEFSAEELVSCLWINFSGDSKQPDPAGPYETLLGRGYYTERLFALSFQVSPGSFFQNNIPMAERLFSTAREWIAATASSVLFDVCCGTGVIGLSMASSVKEVLGVDICEPAIHDAINNATLNNVQNCRFLAGKAEDVLPTVIHDYQGQDICAIVDPARPGLHPSVISTIRKCGRIKRLVYISCNPSAFVNDLKDLCRAPSKTMPGTPFKPIKSQGFDMFPETEHVELLTLFER